MLPDTTVAALSDPVVPVTRGWVGALSLANVAVYAAFFGPIQVLLAQQSEHLAPGNKEAVFGLVTGVGAAVSLVSNPLFGALSDRTTSRFGRRVPWVVGGAITGAAGLLLLAGAPVVALMVIGWCLVQGACNALLAAITAAVPDRVPQVQRGAVGPGDGLDPRRRLPQRLERAAGVRRCGLRPGRGGARQHQLPARCARVRRAAGRAGQPGSAGPARCAGVGAAQHPRSVAIPGG